MSRASGLRNITFDDRDQTNLRYQGSWFLTGSWNASNVGETGTLSSTNDPNAEVTFTFPSKLRVPTPALLQREYIPYLRFETTAPAVAFYYYGILRSKGGQYGICIDCDPNNRIFIPIDGVNATDDGHNPPIVLFSMHFTDAGVHEVVLSNEVDPRFGGNSQLTIDRFDLEVADTSIESGSETSLSRKSTVTLATSSSLISRLPSSGSFSSSSTSNTITFPFIIDSVLSSSPFSSTISILSSPTQNITEPLSHKSTALSSPVPIGPILGGTLGGLALFLSLLLFLFWLRIKRQKAAFHTSARHQQERYTNGHLLDRSHHARPFPYRAPRPTLAGPSIEPVRSQKGVVHGRQGGQSQSKLQSSHSTHSDIISPVVNSSSSALTPSSTVPTALDTPRLTLRREQDAGPVSLLGEEVEFGDTLPPEYASVFAAQRPTPHRSA